MGCGESRRGNPSSEVLNLLILHVLIEVVRSGIVVDKPTKNICEELCELALKLGSGDNITVIIIQFSSDDI